MSITTGSRIGPYEVQSQLGEGGMGVVFRAHDTKLLRDVAIKVLPDHFADDPERLSRLQREAQLLASLNHPNIAQVYGLEQVGESGCIVMELVEGETLAERIKKGPLPYDEVSEIAKQIANALAAAHERGIVHRDLKPANIKLTPNGTVKVLDFGLAKALSATGGESNLSDMPTKVSSGSIAGAVVGTIGYMSPEQARGKEVDARSDIWAFGCVVYEMLTGKLAFYGETATDMLARIVSGQPDLELLPPDIPSAMRLLLVATLNKNSQQRLQHISDSRLFLDQSILPLSGTELGQAGAAAKKNRGILWIASFAAGLAVALVLAAIYIRSNVSPSPSLMQLEMTLPDYATGVSVSPDGQRIAYIALPPEDNRAVWVRQIASEKAQKLAGTDKVTSGQLVWSPDSSHLLFISEGKLKKVDAATGGIQVICDLSNQNGMAWGPGNTILFSSKGVIMKVSADGGQPTQVTTLDTNAKETLHAIPLPLPDGNHFIYAVISTQEAGIFLGTLDGKTKTRLLPLANRLTGLTYVQPGYLLIGGETLRAHRFDASKFTIDPSPIQLAEGIDNSWSASNTGVLLYRKASTTSANKQLTWFDHGGKQAGIVGAAANYGDVELSPTGDRVAVDMITNNNRDVWVIDVARSVTSRITFDPGSDWSPAWSPDGSKIAFASSRGGTNHIYQKSSTGVGNDDLMFKGDNGEILVNWSHDAKWMIFSRLKQQQGQVGADTWVLNLSGEPKAAPFLESPFDKAEARISPDGKWVAYTTNDSGTYQIVVQSFPDPNGGKWQITSQGGIEPKWRHDGRELYYLAFDGKLMAVPIKADRGIEAGMPMPLFETPLTVSRAQTPRDRRYDVTPDGRFLIAVPAAGAPIPITAVVNWASGAEKK